MPTLDIKSATAMVILPHLQSIIRVCVKIRKSWNSHSSDNESEINMQIVGTHSLLSGEDVALRARTTNCGCSSLTAATEKRYKYAHITVRNLLMAIITDKRIYARSIEQEKSIEYVLGECSSSSLFFRVEGRMVRWGGGGCTDGGGYLAPLDPIAPGALRSADARRRHGKPCSGWPWASHKAAWVSRQL